MKKGLENAPVIRATLVTYNFDTRIPDEKKDYENLKKILKGFCRGYGYQCFNAVVVGNEKEGIISGEIDLDCSFIFSNQWNTTDNSPTNGNHRVFDWYEGIYANRSIKKGHYLIPTGEMNDIRRSVVKCGYCGAYYWASQGYTFCKKCIGSEHLREKDLFMLRLQCVTDGDRKPLTDAEKAYILPLFVVAQTEGANTLKGKLLTKQRNDIAAKYNNVVRNATIERDGFNWLMDRNMNTDNVIYYPNTGVFSIGWRKPVDECLLSSILDIISEFPFVYEIKTFSGRTLTNNGNVQ